MTGVVVLLAGLAAPSTATAAHAKKAEPTIKVKLYPGHLVQVYDTVGMYVTVSGSHGTPDGKIEIKGRLGGNCPGKSGLRTHKHGPPSTACTSYNFAALGRRDFTITYYGDKNYRKRTITVPLFVTRDYIGLDLSATPHGPVKAGSPVTLKVDSDFDLLEAHGTSAGTVAFSTEKGPINGCARAKLSDYRADDSGSATCHTTLPAGVHTIKVRFAGSKHNEPAYASMPFKVTK